MKKITRALQSANHEALQENQEKLAAELSAPHAETTNQEGRGPISAIDHPARPSPASTVLVVEDEGLLRQALSKMLAKRGVSVIDAENGLAALDAIRDRNNTIDVLFLDVALPGASGQEVLQEARRLRPEMRVIVTSAYPEEMAATLLQSTIEHFIRKPYRLDDVMRLINSTKS